jgi:hypothetical protein
MGATAGAAGRQMALAAILTIKATSAVLKTKEIMPCAVAVRRMVLSVIPTSETCAVMPITNEKYTKSHPGVSGYALRREMQAKVSKKGYLGAFGYAPREPSGSNTDFILSRQFGGGSM